MNQREFARRKLGYISNRADGMTGISKAVAAGAVEKKQIDFTGLGENIRIEERASNIVPSRIVYLDRARKGNNPSETLAASLGDKGGNFFKYTVDNSALGAKDIRIALFAGHFDLMGFKLDAEGKSINKHYHDISEINRYGLNVDAVLDDGKQALKGKEDKEYDLVCSAVNQKYSIRNMRDMAKRESFKVTGITFKSAKLDQFEGELEVGTTSAFGRGSEHRYDLGNIVDAFQNQSNVGVLQVREDFTIDQYTYVIMSIAAGQKFDMTIRFE